MGIKVEIKETEKRAIEFPCLMRDKFSCLVVLFTSHTKGTAVVAVEGYKVGDYREDWISADDSLEWEPSPPITLSDY